MPHSEKKLHIVRQPTETSCGATCLHAVFAYYGMEYNLEQLIHEVPQLPAGGTLAVHLGRHALAHGFKAKIYTYNLEMFDPTWFYPKLIGSKRLIGKLKKQKMAKSAKRVSQASDAYIDFLEKGGKIFMEDLSKDLILHFLDKQIPILTGLSSTYLYRYSREYEVNGKEIPDDIRGIPEGHFVVIEKYDHEKELVSIADPYSLNPYSPTLRYHITMPRLLTALLLGVLTYDANFLVVEPPIVT
jgi:hypothetical protein